LIYGCGNFEARVSHDRVSAWQGMPGWLLGGRRQPALTEQGCFTSAICTPRGCRGLDQERLGARPPARRPSQQVLHPARRPAPACSAIDQQFLQGRSDSSPSTNARARRLGSTPPGRNGRPPVPSAHRTSPATGQGDRQAQRPPQDHQESAQPAMINRWPSCVQHSPRCKITNYCHRSHG